MAICARLTDLLTKLIPLVEGQYTSSYEAYCKLENVELKYPANLKDFNQPEPKETDLDVIQEHVTELKQLEREKEHPIEEIVIDTNIYGTSSISDSFWNKTSTPVSKPSNDLQQPTIIDNTTKSKPSTSIPKKVKKKKEKTSKKTDDIDDIFGSFL